MIRSTLLQLPIVMDGCRMAEEEELVTQGLLDLAMIGWPLTPPVFVHPTTSRCSRAPRELCSVQYLHWTDHRRRLEQSTAPLVLENNGWL